MYEIRSARDRKVVRRAVSTRCEAVADRGFRLVGRTLRDLSLEGAFLETDADVQLGEEVYLAFQAPRTRLWMDARARVVRQIPGRREGDRGRGVGLRFEAIEAMDRAVLAGSLEHLPPTAPARHLRADYASSVLDIYALRTG